MSRALYEQYKEALRRGHLAALRGRLDAAEAAYRAAAAIAPDRALPYVSLGGVLRRLERLDEALAAYGVALSLVPEDEGALRGRAELQADQGRRAEAALDFERLAGVLEGAGRQTDAADAARRALELAESRSRRREMERLGGLLRDSGEDRSAVDALDRALRILEAVDASAGRSTGTPVADAAPVGVEESAVPGPEPGAAPEPEGGLSAEPGPGPGPEAPSEPDLAVLRAVADALLDSGDLAGASERLLALAALHRAAGRHDAAMDACLTLLAMTPSDHRLQREIAAIQLDRGWNSVAVEKLHLLARLADLDGDVEARAAIAAFAVERGLEPPPGAVPPG
jgi:tetratricopeptide (TPR) repeat protein